MPDLSTNPTVLTIIYHIVINVDATILFGILMILFTIL